jgi:hypothetical protein
MLLCKLLPLFVVACSVAACGHSGISNAGARIPLDPASVTWKELAAVYAKLDETGRNQDLAGRMALISPDYTATLADGTRWTYADLETRVRNLFSQTVASTGSTCTITIESAVLQGDKATVEARQHCPRKQSLRDGAIHDVYTSVLQSETWIRTLDGWKLWRVEDERDQVIEIDGVPSNPDGSPKTPGLGIASPGAKLTDDRRPEGRHYIRRMR